MSEQTLQRIEAKLDTIVRLIGSRVIEGGSLEGKNQSEKIKVLGNLGVERNLIACILGTTPETVRVTLAKAKRGPKNKKRKGNHK